MTTKTKCQKIVIRRNKNGELYAKMGTKKVFECFCPHELMNWLNDLPTRHTVIWKLKRA